MYTWEEVKAEDMQRLSLSSRESSRESSESLHPKRHEAPRLCCILHLLTDDPESCLIPDPHLLPSLQHISLWVQHVSYERPTLSKGYLKPEGRGIC